MIYFVLILPMAAGVLERKKTRFRQLFILMNGGKDVEEGFPSRKPFLRGHSPSFPSGGKGTARGK